MTVSDWIHKVTNIVLRLLFKGSTIIKVLEYCFNILSSFRMLETNNKICLKHPIGYSNKTEASREEWSTTKPVTVIFVGNNVNYK